MTRPDRPTTRLAVTLPPGDQLSFYDGIALSPDGRDLIYIRTRDGVAQLYRRSMHELEAVPIRGTEGPVDPCFSPDGRWLAFFTPDALKKVSVSGGPALTLAEVGDASFGSKRSKRTRS